MEIREQLAVQQENASSREVRTQMQLEQGLKGSKIINPPLQRAEPIRVTIVSSENQ